MGLFFWITGCFWNKKRDLQESNMLIGSKVKSPLLQNLDGASYAMCCTGST